MGSQDDRPAEASPVREHVGSAHESGGIKGTGDNAHSLLRVVPAVAEAVRGSGKKLELTKPFVHELRRFVLKNPVSGDHEGETKHHAHDRSDYDEDESFVPALRDDH
jgi:hypothetical protein